MAYTNDPALQSNQLPLSIDFPEDQEQLRQTLSSSYKRTVDSVNSKEGALYPLKEVANFQRFFIDGKPNEFRNGYRYVFKLDPNKLTFNHNISNITEMTNYRAIVTTSLGDFRKVPYTDVTNVTNQISMRVTQTQVIITNGATAPTITSGMVILDYLKTR